MTDRTIHRDALLRMRQADIIGYVDPNGDTGRNWSAEYRQAIVNLRQARPMPPAMQTPETTGDFIRALLVALLLVAALISVVIVGAAYLPVPR